MSEKRKPSSPSSFDDVEACEELLRKTEDNLKLIERIDHDFIVPALNEWRYATRHVITAATRGGEASQAEWRKALSHVKRAYFDSCDILLTCNLSRAKEILSACAGFKTLVAHIVPEYPDIREKILAAQTASLENNAVTAEEKEARFKSLEPLLRDLSDAVAKLSVSQEEIQEEIRKEICRDRMKAIFAIIGAIGVVQGILQWFL